MSAKHTPGPWTVYDPEMPDTEATYGINGPQGQPVVYFGLTKNDGINRLEDARLIAAAPDLLDALTKLVEDLEMRSNWKRGAENGVVDCGNSVYRNARAAIAKAIG